MIGPDFIVGSSVSIAQTTKCWRSEFKFVALRQLWFVAICLLLCAKPETNISLSHRQLILQEICKPIGHNKIYYIYYNLQLFAVPYEKGSHNLLNKWVLWLPRFSGSSAIYFPFSQLILYYSPTFFSIFRADNSQEDFTPKFCVYSLSLP
jgi:hypothetical protein